MKKTCPYCMKIVDMNHECLSKPKRKYKVNKYSEQNAEIKRFRSSGRWQKKAAEIKDRDNYLCQVCLRELYNTFDKYTYEDLEVHHIYKLVDRFDNRLNNYSLITLCKMHHTMADMGEIPIKILLEIAEEQEDKK